MLMDECVAKNRKSIVQSAPANEVQVKKRGRKKWKMLKLLFFYFTWLYETIRVEQRFDTRMQRLNRQKFNIVIRKVIKNCCGLLQVHVKPTPATYNEGTHVKLSVPGLSRNGDDQ